MASNNVTERSLREYLVSRLKENGFTDYEFQDLRDVMGDIMLKKVFARLNYDWEAFDEYIDELIDTTLHGSVETTDNGVIYDDMYDFERFDPRYDEEGFMTQRHYANDQLPPDYDARPDVKEIDRWRDSNHGELTDEEKKREQERYEAESERNRIKRLACETPEELYNFKRKMGWLPSLAGKTPEQRAEMERIELEKCAAELAMRKNTNESKNNTDSMNKYYNSKTSNGIRLYEYGGTYPPKKVERTDRLGYLAEIRRMFQTIANNVEDLEKMQRDLRNNLTHNDAERCSDDDYRLMQRYAKKVTSGDLVPTEYYERLIDDSIAVMNEALNDCEEAFTKLAKRAFPYRHMGRLEESFNPRKNAQYINKKMGDTRKFRK